MRSQIHIVKNVYYLILVKIYISSSWMKIISVKELLPSIIYLIICLRINYLYITILILLGIKGSV